ncbi:MAG: hypothetical protein IKV94_02395 [Clostridia bacterium]|nr:hypothetical protein [Clostridia bacterium]
MWNNSNNSFIWLILLILIFFSDTSSNSIGANNYFKLTSPTTDLFNAFI